MPWHVMSLCSLVFVDDRTMVASRAWCFAEAMAMSVGVRENASKAVPTAAPLLRTREVRGALPRQAREDVEILVCVL